MKAKTSKQFKEAYPDKYNYIKSLPLELDPDGRCNPTSGQPYKGYRMRCSICDKEIFVNLGNVWHDTSGDGTFRCKQCCLTKMMNDLGKEGLKERSRKVRKNQLQNQTPEQRRAAAMKAFETNMKKGTCWRSEWEPIIDREYGSIHYFDGDYEIDCYWPNKKLGIEIDDPKHDEGGHKPIGYHKAKDDHYAAKGIKILHLTFNRFEGGDVRGWRGIVEDFLNGTYDGPLINLDDPTYGDIVYD